MSPSRRRVRAVIMPRVALLRGLEFKRPVPMETVARARVGDYVSKEIDEEMPPAKMDGYQRLLAYMNLLEEDTDLKQLLTSAYGAGVAGWYDDEEKKFCIVGGVGGHGVQVFDEITAAHELTHALQDQHFDLLTLRRLAEDHDDAMLAIMALAEGDACDLMLRYKSNLTRADTGPVRDQWRFIAANMPSHSTSGLPLFIVQNMTFPYSYGTRFIELLMDKGGPDAVDIAFRDPPLSTEQLTDPRKYFYRDEPSLIVPPDLEGVVPEPWRMVEGEQLGQFNLGLVLALHLGEGVVDDAVAGWGGDIIIGWWRPDTDECCAAYYSTWDSVSDAAEFFAVARRLAEVRCAGFEPCAAGDYFASWHGEGKLTYLRAVGRDVVYVENIPREHAAALIMRLWDSVKRPLGLAVPVADRDRKVLSISD